MQHTKDETLILETGEYSDYSFQGPFKVLRSFESQEEAERHTALFDSEVKEKNGDHGTWDHASPDTLIAYLAAEGFIEELSCVREHVGSYGAIDIVV